MNYYSHHIGDYRSATMHLTNDEDLAYRRLLEMYYDTERAIPLETQWVSRRLRLDTEVIENVLNDFFIWTENGWEHARCEREIADYQATVQRNKTNGKKGGRPRKDQSPSTVSGQSGAIENKPTSNPVESQEKPSGFPVGSQSQPTGKATKNQEPITNNQDKNKTPKPPSPKTARDECLRSEFDEVWMLYPPRTGASKANSFKAYKARREQGYSAEEIRQGVVAYARYVEVCNFAEQYIKQPETFFGPGLHFQSDWTPPTSRAIASGPNPNARIAAGMEAVKRAKALILGSEHETV